MDAFVTRHPRTHDASSQKQTPPTEEAPQRPAKRFKIDEIADSASDDGDYDEYEKNFETIPEMGDQRNTEIENALPATQSEDEAAEEYEKFKLSQGEKSDDPGTELRPKWVRGRKSIYVDAFNLALDTVLEEESHLFDEQEKKVFDHWKQLDYETQFMYVRLFLRKTDCWHRISRLGHYTDVSDPERAIQALQEPRALSPEKGSVVGEEPLSLPGMDLPEMALGDDEFKFTFADSSERYFNSVEETASLLSLDELRSLARQAKVRGKNKAELVKSLARMSQTQTGLMSLGLSRQNSLQSEDGESRDLPDKGQGFNREQHFLQKVVAILGPCVRLSPGPFKLFERVHLVFYRSTMWTEKSLTTLILAKISRRNFPEYIVCRSSTIFASRAHLVEFEAAVRLGSEVDRISETSEVPVAEAQKRIFSIFETVYPRWKQLIAEEQAKEGGQVYEMGEGAYLRRFIPAHSYTRIVHKVLAVLARWKDHRREYGLLVELLGQRFFHPARRGAWYQRKALLEEHYMAALDEDPASSDSEIQKKHWKKKAIETCEAGLQDADCHLIYHHDLQKRLVKLERKLRIPKRLQHDFGHVRLTDPAEVTVEGIQIVGRDVTPKPGRQTASTRTAWVDEAAAASDEAAPGDGECTVEEMCLSHFRSRGWKGYHAEGGIVRTLFAYLLYDVLFLYIPNVFQTAYQTCPLDLHTDAFYPSRASEINHRLVQIANGEGERLVREVWAREHPRRTNVVGLDWDFDVDDVAELVACFDGEALAAICKVMAQEYGQRGGGIPDLILWRRAAVDGAEDGDGQQIDRMVGEVMMAEVKSMNDRLSDTQRLWIHVLTGAGVKVVLCNAVAKEVRKAD
ncbi:fanconi-associated nuclease 1 [Geosmithia morbida]|uniref:Fanconi-associated nuclease n=1 Tax=Geosmithia morbida TaxID=1094350 RepID=A0A9P4YX93_9HYPO|nr:fanconi-associated nuclease 1 [Geosmithia morbida]KAF4123487.1 fanconi-associated nuclease 1 [Geosmithia morbida]